MKAGLRYARGRSVLVVGGLILGILAGCDNSDKYPRDLRYPARTDLLVKGTEGEPTVTQLPPPGHIDDHIAKASADKLLKTINPRDVASSERKELESTLVEIFGTPAVPSVEPLVPAKGSEQRIEDAKAKKVEFDTALGKALNLLGAKVEDVEALGLDPRTLSRGSELYRRHCLHCHGLAGDGRGPTGPWVHPHPRDYRKGIFKFVSTSIELTSRKPRKADLRRTLEHGIDGTSMPAFGLLPAQELDQLVAYVMHLSLRGEVEFQTLMDLKENRSEFRPEGETIPEGNVREYVYRQAAFFLVQWGMSNGSPTLTPPEYKVKDDEAKALHASITRGYQLFIDQQKGLCLKCHFDFGRQSAYRYDDWGTLVRPRDLTQTNYRGGRRPIDLFWRVRGGIGTYMPKVEKGTIPDDQIWDLVNFVQYLPYPGMLPEEVRSKVYERPESRKVPVAQADR